MRREGNIEQRPDLSFGDFIGLLGGVGGIAAAVFPLVWYARLVLVAIAVTMIVIGATRFRGPLLGRMAAALLFSGVFIYSSYGPISEDFSKSYPSIEEFLLMARVTPFRTAISGGVLTIAGISLLVAGILWGFSDLIGSRHATRTLGATAKDPEFAVLAPVGRYLFRWNPEKSMRFDIRRDTEKRPDYTNNPAFTLRNKVKAVAYNVTATWKSEISGIEELTKISPTLSKFKIEFKDSRLVLHAAPGETGFVYDLGEAKQTLPVVAREAQIYLPLNISALAALFLIDKMPAKIGETTEPFIARLSVSTESGAENIETNYRVKITATNTKATPITDPPLVDSVLNFSVEELR